MGVNQPGADFDDLPKEGFEVGNLTVFIKIAPFIIKILLLIGSFKRKCIIMRGSKEKQRRDLNLLPSGWNMLGVKTEGVFNQCCISV